VPVTVQCAPDKLVPDLHEECIYALCLDGREGHAVYSRRAIVLLGQHIGRT
jgi:hypothetical protein